MDKTATDREYFRMKLYCDVFLALANHKTASRDKAEVWSSSALEAFDKHFPENTEQTQ